MPERDGHPILPRRRVFEGCAAPGLKLSRAFGTGVIMNDLLMGSALLNRPRPDTCARCRKAIDDPANAIAVVGTRKIGRREIPLPEQLVCMACWWNPDGPRPEQPKPARTLPWKTLAEASARAEKIAAFFGRTTLPDIGGNTDTGYWVFGDTPTVPGFKPGPCLTELSAAISASAAPRTART
jgi:hypothetical protein